MDSAIDTVMHFLTEYTMSIVMIVLATIVLVGFARIGRAKKRRMESR